MPSDDLGANWKSALCVTSLYDSYVQLQQENAALQVQVQELTRRALGAQPLGQGEENGDDDEASHFVQPSLRREVALLRREKEQLELALVQQRQHADAKLAALADKFEQRYALDPNGAKRVALATSTLQEALEGVVQEKEELVRRHETLRQHHLRLQQEQNETRQRLQALMSKRVARTKRMVGEALQRWYSGQLGAVWRRWTSVVALYKLRESEHHVREAIRSEIDAKEKLLRKQKAARVLGKRLQSTTRRGFLAWRLLVQRRQHARYVVVEFRRRCARRMIGVLFSKWKRDSQAREMHRRGLERLERTLSMHCKQAQWRKWMRRVFVEHVVADLQSTIAALHKHVAYLEAELASTSARLATAENEKADVLAKYRLDQRTLAERVSEKQSMEVALIARIGGFFARQNDRHLLQSTMEAWKRVSTANRVLRQRASRVHKQIVKARARRGVIRWRAATQNRRRYGDILMHFVVRMRQLGVFQCFNAWKAFMDAKHERTATIRRVGLYIAHKHVSSCFERWREFRTRRQEVRVRLLSVEATAVRIQQSAAFAAWRQQIAAAIVVAEIKRQQELQLRIEQANHDATVLRSCLLRWRRAIRSAKYSKQLAAKVLSRWRNMLLSSVFNDWQRFVSEREHQRELIARWLRRYSTASLQHAWIKWQKQIILKTQQEMLARVREEHASVVARLQAEILQLHTAHQNLVSDKTASTQTFRIQFEHSRTEMEREIRRQEKLSSALVLLAVRKRNVRLQRASFRGWRNRVIALKHIREYAMKRVLRAEMQILTTVFGAWRHLLQQHSLLIAAASLLRSFMEQHHVYRCFMAWSRDVRSVRHFQDRLLRRFLRAVLREWKRESRKNYLVRRTAERIWQHAVHVRMRGLFDKWAAINRQERLVELKIKRKEMFASIELRVFSRWTHCSIRLVFVAWRLAVSHMRRVRQAESKLGGLRATRLLCAGFDSLRRNKDRKLDQRKHVLRLIEKRAHGDQRSAFALWRAEHLRCQRREVEALRADRTRLEGELLRSREGAAQAEKTLEQAKQHESMVQVLSRERILDRHIRAWRTCVLESKYVEQLAQQLAIDADKRKKLTVFFCWKTTWTNAKVRWDLRRKQRGQVQKRTHFQAWVHHTQHRHNVGIRLAVLADRRRIRALMRVLHRWRSYLSLNRSIRAFIPGLEGLARRLRLGDALEAWHKVVTAIRSTELKEKERQRRILEFIMARHRWTLQRVFSPWLSVTAAKRSIRLEAHQRFAAKNKCLAATVFATWKFAVQQRKDLHCLLVTLSRNFERYFLRMAVSTWRNRVCEYKIRVMQVASETQAHELEVIRQQLESTTSHAEEFQYSLKKNGEEVAHLKAMLMRSSAETSSLSQRYQQKTQQTRIFVKLVLQRSVSRTTLAAFTLWRKRCEILQSHDRALRRLERLLSRNQRAKAFMRWKTKSQRALRLLRVQQRRTILHMRTIFAAWTRHCCAGIRAKMLLLRLCVVMEAQDAQRRLTVCGAFRILYKHCIAAHIFSQMTLFKESAQLNAQANALHRAKLLLLKWSWRGYFVRLQALHRFFSRCRGESSRQQVLKFRRVIEDLEATKESMEKQLETLTHELQQAAKQRLLLAAATDERSVFSSCLPGLRSLFRHLAQVASTKELFTKISSSFPQMLHGSSAILFLHDPSSNELWTQREDAKILQVPASLGIAGYTFSSCSSVLVDDISSDQRFHALVDQFVVSSLCHETLTGSSSLAMSRPSDVIKPKITLFSSALLSHEGITLFDQYSRLSRGGNLTRICDLSPIGSVYGVLQVAISVSSMTAPEASFLVSQAQFFGRLCCFYGAKPPGGKPPYDEPTNVLIDMTTVCRTVEQILFEIVRNTSDRVRARAPDTFIRLFKQNRNWRKYFVALERRIRSLDEDLQRAGKECEDLMVAKDQAQQALEQVCEQLEAHKGNEAKVSVQILGWKKKMNKLKRLVETKEREVAERTQEAEAVADEFARYRHQQRSKELQTLLLAPESTQRRSTTHRSMRESAREEVDSISDTRSIGDTRNSLLRADNATLKNQLVRAESDSILLVKAIDTACRRRGELPDAMRTEVNRIALRLKATNQAVSAS